LKHLPISETPKIQSRVTGEQEVFFGKRKRKSGTKGAARENHWGNNCRELMRGINFVFPLLAAIMAMVE
jgi:hypothetical protein